MQPTENKKAESVFKKLPENGFKETFEIKPKEKIWDLDFEMIQESYNKILELWDKDQKSRNFVKHLVAAFLPYNHFNRLAEAPENKDIMCAILNRKVTGIYNIAQNFSGINVKLLFISAHKILGEMDTEEAKKFDVEDIKHDEEIEKIQEEINEKMKNMPDEIKNCHIGVVSETSDKTLMIESVFALLHFSQKMILHGDKEFNFLLKKSRIKRSQENVNEEKKLTDSEVNKVAAVTTYGLKNNISEKTYSALEKLKQSLEKEESEIVVMHEVPKDVDSESTDN